MSYSRTYGKDKVMFVTKEDHATPSKIELPPPPAPQGLITDKGEINWSCPCLGGMATGPCGVEFRDAFSCFHYSEAEPKGSDCYDAFRTMQECFTQYPTVYSKATGGDDDDDDGPGLDMGALEEEVTKMEQKPTVADDISQKVVQAGDSTDLEKKLK